MEALCAGRITRMAVLIILIAVVLLLWVQKKVYQKYWSKRLTAQVKIRDQYMFEGQETEITEIMTNNKLLPLPWVQLKFQIIRNGKTDNLFRSDIFNILFHQQITRKSKITLKRRGVYQIRQLDLLSYDMFITSKFVKLMDNQAQITVYPVSFEKHTFDVPYEKMVGTLATKRYTLEDPFLFKGIRDYQPQDSFKSINFKASAKGGKWLVNTHEYTVDQTVHVLLLTDKSTNYYEEDIYEAALRLAASMISRLERDGIPASFYSNGEDSLEHQEVFLGAGCSENHIDSLLETLARLDMTVTAASGIDVLEGLQEKRRAEDYYVILSACYSQEMVQKYNELRAYTDACMWIAPISEIGFLQMDSRIQNMEKDVEDFYFYKV